MLLRELKVDDTEELRKIHEKFYKHEFDYPDFFHRFICSFVVFDGDQQIISAGGVRPILESVIITNKDLSVRDRRAGLYSILNASAYFTEKSGFNEIHAFVQEPTWQKHLEKIGFKPTKGQSLVIQIGDK